MYKEILAEAGSTLIVTDGCKIKDGRSAITIQLNATTSIVGNSFGRNLVSLQLGEEVAVSQFSLFLAPNGSISENTFDGTETLGSPYLGYRPLSGIRVNAVDNIAIGGLSRQSTGPTSTDVFYSPKQASSNRTHRPLETHSPVQL